MAVSEFNQSIIDEFRSHGGKVGGPFAGSTLLLLKTTGARSGALRTNPVMYFVDQDRYLIVASFAGAAANPPWFHNLIAHPIVEVEMGTEHFKARAEVVGEPERSQLYATIASAKPAFAEYQRKTKRPIPVIALYRQ